MAIPLLEAQAGPRRGNLLWYRTNHNMKCRRGVIIESMIGSSINTTWLCHIRAPSFTRKQIWFHHEGRLSPLEWVYYWVLYVVQPMTIPLLEGQAGLGERSEQVADLVVETYYGTELIIIWSIDVVYKWTNDWFKHEYNVAISYQSIKFHLKTDMLPPRGPACASRMGILVGSIYCTTYGYTTFRGASRPSSWKLIMVPN